MSTWLVDLLTMVILISIGSRKYGTKNTFLTCIRTSYFLLALCGLRPLANRMESQSESHRLSSLRNSIQELSFTRLFFTHNCVYISTKFKKPQRLPVVMIFAVVLIV